MISLTFLGATKPTDGRSIFFLCRLDYRARRRKTTNRNTNEELFYCPLAFAMAQSFWNPLILKKRGKKNSLFHSDGRTNERTSVVKRVVCNGREKEKNLSKIDNLCIDRRRRSIRCSKIVFSTRTKKRFFFPPPFRSWSKERRRSRFSPAKWMDGSHLYLPTYVHEVRTVSAIHRRFREKVFLRPSPAYEVGPRRRRSTAISNPACTSIRIHGLLHIPYPQYNTLDEKRARLW